MDSMRVDKKLIESLNDIQYISNLRTCLLVRIADYAAQLCGCRSTRQVADHQSVDVDNKYYELLHRLLYNIPECYDYINNDHIYKESILQLNDDELELLLEDALFEIIQFDNHSIFAEYFFEQA